MDVVNVLLNQVMLLVAIAAMCIMNVKNKGVPNELKKVFAQDVARPCLRQVTYIVMLADNMQRRNMKPPGQLAAWHLKEIIIYVKSAAGLQIW